MSEEEVRCGWYWGSHGCYLESGHDGHHVCRGCHKQDCEADHANASPRQYGAGGCAGTWPFYGARAMSSRTVLRFFQEVDGVRGYDRQEWYRQVRIHEESR